MPSRCKSEGCNKYPIYNEPEEKKVYIVKSIKKKV